MPRSRARRRPRAQLRVLAGVLAALCACQNVKLNAPPDATLTLSSSASTIPESGGTAVIRAVVRLASGELVPDGVAVNFFTTLGTIDAEARTVSGVATATLGSTGTPGTAVISALSGAAAVATIQVTFGAQTSQVQVRFDPPSLPEGGGSAAVTVLVTDATGAPLAGRVVTLSASSPGQLASAGSARATDASGRVADTITTTATTTVTATVQGTSLTAVATLVVATSAASALLLIAQPASLPLEGGTSVVTAFVTDPGNTPLAGVTVAFSTDPGTVAPASATTDVSGQARTSLATLETAVVTATVGTLSRTIVVGVGSGSQPRRIALSASRFSLTDRSLTQGLGCTPGGPNSDLPITVVVLVTDLSGQGVAGVNVALEIEDDLADTSDGHGGFCVGASAPASCGDPAAGCAARSICPTPTPTPTPPIPTPSPTPTPPTPTPTPVCCPVSRLPQSAVVRTDAQGRAEIGFAVEDIDLCLCSLPPRRCTARILASAPFAQQANDLTISFRP